ncbi:MULTISPECIES: glycosyltransferase [Calothrix]|uniref:Glycosyltransferase n=2 Tax=Calothrix TaxID=1186 RepID=A0ABR8AGG3_9CYAN|nr:MULTISPECIES: glycosyltransferase [Calothrix]MBD2199018.1 glycosyltransferase [Calothrix parietina FACHB-288]MBD2227729.1 glycosyltransferase [Calothrix anomala FACHB-343]
MKHQEFNENTKCPFCASEKISKYKQRSDKIWVLICSNCGLGFVEKYPKNLQSFYELDYYEKSIKSDGDENEIGYINYQEIQHSYFIWAIALIDLVKTGDSLFDLGCSNGIFLDLAKMYGFKKLSGVEYNSEYAEICHRKGYKVYNNSFINIDFNEEQKFNVVTAWAVLEHIPQLTDVFAQIKNILQPDGFLFFEIPCLTFNENADKHWFNSSLEHIYYFTEQSFKKITLHFFGQEYIGRIVNFDNFGSTIIGFVSSDESRMKMLFSIGNNLQQLTLDDLKKLNRKDLQNYLMLYIKYINDLHVLENIVNYIASSWILDCELSDLFILFLGQQYIKLSTDNAQYLNAKEYFVSQLENKNLEIEKLQAQLQKSQANLTAIESSKFWKLRQKWFQFRRLIGILNEDEPISLKKLLKLSKLSKFIQKGLRKLPNFQIRNIRQEKWYEDRPLVSVIIPCFNYGKYVEEAIDSVLSQTFRNFEIIVIDGGSTDDSTISILKSLNKPKTKIYYRESRHLVGDNRNFGIERATGKYICCLDADDKLQPTYLEKAVFLLETYAYDIVSTAVQCFEDSDCVWQIAPQPRLDNIVQANQFSTVAVFSKKMWTLANGYHDYGIGKEHISEDWDLWLRIMALGARATNIPETLMLYRIHSKSSLSNHPEIASYQEQIKVICSFNKKYLTPKNYARSWKTNTEECRVINGTINLINSYIKETKNHQKNILFALPFVITGGADTILLQIAQHLNENDFNISVMTTIKTDANLGDNTHRYEQITKEIYHLCNFLPSEARWKDFIYYFIESRKIDIIFLVGSTYFYKILPDLKRDFPSIKIVDQLFNEYGHINNNRKYAKFIDLNILASEAIKNVLLSKFGELEDKTRVIIHGVDTQNEFNPTKVDEKPILDSNIIPQDKFIVSYMGRFSEEKCPETFLQIVKMLKDYDDMYFIMIGNGPEYKNIKEKVVDWNLTDKIFIPGFVDDNKLYLKITNLLVIPSKIEGIPIILMEGLSLGIPVVASKVGDIPSVITDGYNGFVCDSSDIDGFVANIKQIFLDKELHNKMKANARYSALQNLDITRMKNEYKDAFLSILKK